MLLFDVGVVDPVVGLRVEAGVVRLVDGVLFVVGVVDGLLTGDVVLAGLLFAGLVAGLVLPPPIVPPPLAGSC